MECGGSPPGLSDEDARRAVQVERAAQNWLDLFRRFWPRSCEHVAPVMLATFVIALYVFAPRAGI